jgi:hypothetical protein
MMLHNCSSKLIVGSLSWWWCEGSQLVHFFTVDLDLVHLVVELLTVLSEWAACLVGKVGLVLEVRESCLHDVLWLEAGLGLVIVQWINFDESVSHFESSVEGLAHELIFVNIEVAKGIVEFVHRGVAVQSGLVHWPSLPVLTEQSLSVTSGHVPVARVQS